MVKETLKFKKLKNFDFIGFCPQNILKNMDLNLTIVLLKQFWATLSVDYDSVIQLNVAAPPSCPRIQNKYKNT